MDIEDVNTQETEETNETQETNETHATEVTKLYNEIEELKQLITSMQSSINDTVENNKLLFKQINVNSANTSLFDRYTR